MRAGRFVLTFLPPYKATKEFIMSRRRMFSSDVVDNDKFLDMPVSARCLYYDLGMRADDDGFISPKKILRLTGATDDDLKVLISKGFVILFESGVIVIRDWRLNNYLRKDRYTETIYKNEKAMLSVDDNDCYWLTNGIPNGNQRLTQVRLGEVSIGKGRIEKEKEKEDSFKRRQKEETDKLLEQYKK